MSTLVEDLQTWYTEHKHPPQDVDIAATQVSYERLDSMRWGVTFQAVYKRGDEYVCVQDVEPATEEQDWGDYGRPNIYPVEPYEVAVIKYRKIENVSS